MQRLCLLFLLTIISFPAAFVFADEGGQVCSLYYPHIASNFDWETEIAVINTGEARLSGSLTAYSGAGEPVSSKDIDLLQTERKEISVGSFFQRPAEIRYIKFLGQGSCQGYEKFYTSSGEQRAAVPAVHVDENSLVDELNVTHIATSSEWWTGLALVNTTDIRKELTITFNDQSTKKIPLEAGGHWSGTVGSFSGINHEAVESAVISNAKGVIGLELFGTHLSSDTRYLSGILLNNKPTDHLVFSHVASDSKYWTGVVFYNPNNSQVDLTVSPYSDSGAALANQQITLGPGKKYVSTATNLQLPDETAWFSVDATGGKIEGFELFGTRDGKSLAGYKTTTDGLIMGVFPKIDHNGWTGIAFVNSNERPANITLYARDDSFVGINRSESLIVPGHGKFLRLAEELPMLSGSDYITFESDVEIHGFQLNATDGDAMMDALPALPMWIPLSTTSNLPDTGQTICYDMTGPQLDCVGTDQSVCYDTPGIVSSCAGTGQDGEYLSNPMSYTDNGNGTVTDNVTGLIWQQSFDAQAREWDEAVTYCNNYLPDGSSWRLPTVQELQGIIDVESPTGLNSIFSVFDERSAFYWSSTVTANDPNYAWSAGGKGKVWASSKVNDGGCRYFGYCSNVRCVR